MLRIAYFAKGAAPELQPVGSDWRSAKPRLVLDLANPAAPSSGSGSSLLVVLDQPVGSGHRQRPAHLVVDHRVRHPLNAHAKPRAGPVDDIARPAAALQLWHANDAYPWTRHGTAEYPAIAFWSAGVSERNQEDPAHLDRAWGWVQTPTNTSGSYSRTTLYALAGDTGAGPLEASLRSASWEKADPTGPGIPALAEMSLRPSAASRPLRYFGLQRERTVGQEPELSLVIGGDFPLANPVPGSIVPSLQLPSGFAVSDANKLERRRPMRAVRPEALLDAGATPTWFEPADLLQWSMSVIVDADDLDPVPAGGGGPSAA